jgi:capsular exopolysaccharide synthesis family protein
MEEERVELEKAARPEPAPLAPPGYPRAAGYPDAYGYGYGYGESDDRLSLRSLWRIVRKRRRLIAVIAVIVTAYVAIDVYRTKNLYRASTTIEISKDNPTVLRTGDTVIQGDDYLDMYYISTVMKSKIRLLESRPLLEDVVVRLRLDKNPAFLNAGVQANDDADGLDQSFEPLDASVRTAEESQRLEPFVDMLAAGLIAEPLEDTTMLVVSYTHTNPALAATIANTVAEVFIDYNFERKTERFTKTSQWLEESTRKLKSRAQEAEQALANYTREHNIFSLEGKETLTNDKLSRLHDQATRAETDRMLRESLYEQVKQGKLVQLPEAFADPKTAALQAKLGELAVQAADLDVKFGPKNPRVIAVRQQMAAIQQQIDENRKTLEEKLKADYERALRDEQSLKEALARAKAEAVRQNQDAIQYNILRQEVETAKALYTDFLQKTNQANVQRAEQHSSIKVIDPARTPKSPIAPRRLRAIMIALFLSLTAGVGIAVLLERLDNTIKSVEDVNRYTQLPALGIIPAAGERQRLLGPRKRRRARAAGRLVEVGTLPLIALDGRSSAAEAYRVLRTSVLLSAAGKPPKSILITSSQPGEGKTTTTINTAISLAQLGASVLIIDCDMRKPTAHKVLNVDHARGLSTYLSRDIGVEDLIHRVQIANLSILPCGPLPPNPAELISSDKMKELMQMMGERYDHILIDSPPLINVTDPVILSTIVDGVILVVHGGKSTRDIVRRARQELCAVGAKIFGVVLNNVDLRREGYDDYYYYRHYSDYFGRGTGDAAGTNP